MREILVGYAFQAAFEAFNRLPLTIIAPSAEYQAERRSSDEVRILGKSKSAITTTGHSVRASS
jgi:hypothetical protein